MLGMGKVGKVLGKVGCRRKTLGAAGVLVSGSEFLDFLDFLDFRILGFSDSLDSRISEISQDSPDPRRRGCRKDPDKFGRKLAALKKIEKAKKTV